MDNDKLLVQLIDKETEQVISSYRTTNWSEAFKLYHYILNHANDTDIEVHFEDLSEDFENKNMLISDMCIQFGGENGLNALRIYVETF